MYGWIWSHLPGPWPVKAVLALALLAIVVLLCFQYVFPWLESVVPWLGDVTVDNSPSAAGAAGIVLPRL
ncbi:MAG: hypothetical protein LCI03_01665 [Actinobacteria bacterium]|nr:hypothetical protein [Actinomycetota bacterium]